MTYLKQYTKTLTHLTTFRLSNQLRTEAEECAEYLGISLSDFIRQSLNRNIRISHGIEDEVTRQATERAIGR